MTPHRIICPPDLSSRPFNVTAERLMALPAAVVYSAWTEHFDTWFAAPGSVLMIPVVNTPFFFETRFEDRHYPHYGRFLRLEENKLVEMTWVTAGTKGVETVLSITLTENSHGTRVRLLHAGFPDEESRKRHSDAWPLVLEQLEKRMAENGKN